MERRRVTYPSRGKQGFSSGFYPGRGRLYFFSLLVFLTVVFLSFPLWAEDSRKESSPPDVSAPNDSESVGSVISSYFLSPKVGRLDPIPLLAGLIDANLFDAAERLGEEILGETTLAMDLRLRTAGELLRLYERELFVTNSGPIDRTGPTVMEKVAALRERVEGVDGTEGTRPDPSQKEKSLPDFVTRWETSSPESALEVAERDAAIFYALELMRWEAGAIRRNPTRSDDGDSWRNIMAIGRRIQPILERAWTDSVDFPSERGRIRQLTAILCDEEGKALLEVGRLGEGTDQSIPLAISLFQKSAEFSDGDEKGRALAHRLDALRILKDRDRFAETLREDRRNAGEDLRLLASLAAAELRFLNDSDQMSDRRLALQIARSGKDSTGTPITIPDEWKSPSEADAFADFTLARLETLLQVPSEDGEEDSPETAPSDSLDDSELLSELSATLSRGTASGVHPIWKFRALALLGGNEADATGGVEGGRTPDAILVAGDALVREGRYFDAFRRWNVREREGTNFTTRDLFRLRARQAGLLDEIVQDRLFTGPDQNQLSELASFLVRETDYGRIGRLSDDLFRSDPVQFWRLATEEAFSTISRDFPEEKESESFSSLALDYAADLVQTGGMSAEEYLERRKIHSARFNATESGGGDVGAAEWVRARSLFDAGEKQKGIDLLAKRLREKPDDADALLLLAEVLAEESEIPVRRKSLSILQSLTDRFPKESEKWFRVRELEILLNLRLGNRAEAEKIARLLELAYPDYGDPERKRRIEIWFSEE